MKRWFRETWAIRHGEAVAAAVNIQAGEIPVLVHKKSEAHGFSRLNGVELKLKSPTTSLACWKKRRHAAVLRDSNVVAIAAAFTQACDLPSTELSQ